MQDIPFLQVDRYSIIYFLLLKTVRQKVVHLLCTSQSPLVEAAVWVSLSLWAFDLINSINEGGASLCTALYMEQVCL